MTARKPCWNPCRQCGQAWDFDGGQHVPTGPDVCTEQVDTTIRNREPGVCGHLRSDAPAAMQEAAAKWGDLLPVYAPGWTVDGGGR